MEGFKQRRKQQKNPVVHELKYWAVYPSILHQYRACEGSWGEKDTDETARWTRSGMLSPSGPPGLVCFQAETEDPWEEEKSIPSHHSDFTEVNGLERSRTTYNYLLRGRRELNVTQKALNSKSKFISCLWIGFAIITQMSQTSQTSGNPFLNCETGL